MNGSRTHLDDLIRGIVASAPALEPEGFLEQRPEPLAQSRAALDHFDHLDRGVLASSRTEGIPRQ